MTSIEATKRELQMVQKAEDAGFCDDDAWYAEEMTANQQLMDKMRAEDTASQKTTSNKEYLNHDAECLAAAKKNDLATWKKSACK